MKTVFITGADRGIGFAFCEEFIAHGWTVFAGRFLNNWPFLDKLKAVYPETLICVPIDVSDQTSVNQAATLVADHTDHIDLLINCAGIGIDDGYEQNIKTMLVNTLGPIQVTEAFLPLMKKGMKRLCYVSSEAGSIALCHRSESFSYCMSKSALNMAIRLMFNHLYPEGYSFRVYHPGWVNSYMEGEEISTEGTYQPEDTAKTAYQQFTNDREFENVLIMTDILNQTWAF